MKKLLMPLIGACLFSIHSIIPMDLEFKEQEYVTTMKTETDKLIAEMDVLLGKWGKKLLPNILSNEKSKSEAAIHNLTCRLQMIGASEHWPIRKLNIKRAILDDKIHPDSFSYFIACEEATKKTIEQNIYVDKSDYSSDRITLTPLCDAFLNNDLEFTQFLLSHGANPSSPNSCIAGTSLMHYVATIDGYSPELITLYGKHGSDTSFINGKGNTPLMELAMKATGTQQDCEKVRQLIDCGVPYSRPVTMSGTYKNMNALQIIEKRIADTPLEADDKLKVKPELLTCMQCAHKARKEIVVPIVHEKLLMDPTNIVLSYDE